MDSCFSYSNLKIHFNNKLYNIGAIKEAADAFKDFFEFEIKEEGTHIIIELNFSNKDDNLTVAREFCNYILGVMQNNR